MSIAWFHYAAIPRQHWADMAPGRLGYLAVDALGIERRLDKEINLASESARYVQICRRLEEEAWRLTGIGWVSDVAQICEMLKADRAVLFAADTNYLEIIWKSLLTPAWERFGRGFFPPQHLETHRHAFDTWARTSGVGGHPAVVARSSVLTALADYGAGLVELQWHGLSGTTFGHFPAWQPPTQKAILADPVFSPADTEPHATDHGVGKMGQYLRQQIAGALRNGSPVCFGNQAPHDVIAECLHDFVYGQSQNPGPASFRVVYADGSEARPFPVLCLDSQQLEPSVSVLRVALISMRHLDLDTEVDFCWFRNREASRSWTHAEADEFCYKETRRQLVELMSCGPLRLILYHTGFEPACLGFYRGLVETILERLNQNQPVQLQVEPRYLRGCRYDSGTVWN